MARVAQTASEEETLLNRGYKLMRKLGEGSYAKVYLASYAQKSSGNEKDDLACKIIDTSRAPRDFVRKFLPRELEILVKVNHPYIIHVHSIFQRRSKYFIFMRFAELGDLLDFILKRGAIKENQCRVWMRQLTLALQYLHALQIAHRDLKCENVLITANFNCKIADFGFARSTVDQNNRMVLSETYCGSLSYAAPEVLAGKPYNPRRADLWSLGVILYVMFNKSMPFDDNNVKRLHDLQMNKRWKFRSKVVESISENAKDVVRNLLEPDLRQRWDTEKILESPWVTMDPRLATLTEQEQAAKDAAGKRQLDKKTVIEKAALAAARSTEVVTVIQAAKKFVDDQSTLSVFE